MIPRRLLTRIDAEHFHGLILVAHAPQSGIAFHERKAWWEETERLVAALKQEEPLFVLLDANASPGQDDHPAVLGVGCSPSSGTQLLQHFLVAFDLCLPSTSEWHVGDRKTWTSPDGVSSHQIDFVAVPHQFLECCTWSETLDNFDLATVGFDHTAVGLEMQWSHWNYKQSATAKQSSVAYDRTKIGQACFFEDIVTHEAVPWSTDVERHVQDLNDLLHGHLKSKCGRSKMPFKKPFVTRDIWEIRNAKLAHRRQLKSVQKLLRREALARIFLAWKEDQADALTLSFNFGCTLLSGGLKHAVGLICRSRQLKCALKKAKQQVLADKFAQFTPDVSASFVLHTLKPFVGSSNALKRGPKPLPFVYDDTGQPCEGPQEALRRWIEFFMHMEGGFRASAQAQRDRWIANMAKSSVQHDDIPIAEVPSLIDLETAMRRIKPGKATGPDLLPAELFHFHAAAVAKQSYALFLKTAVQAQEPLVHKGGWLMPLWKGKGDQALCTSYRSILISAHMAKAFHRSLRTRNASIYESFMQNQQIGGRRATPVGLGIHQVRAFQRAHGGHSRPVACIFLDLAEAFYRIVRPLAISGEVTDELLANVAQRLNLDHNALAELHALMLGPSALDDAGMPSHAKRAVCGIHQDTHFALHGQVDRCVTTIGGRPGDAWADIVFGFLWAKVLHQLQEAMRDLGFLELVPDQDKPNLFATIASSEPTVGFLGPCWCDDLCVCVSADDMPSLTNKTGTVAGILIDLCLKFGMLPNLQRGKTEILFTARGRGCRQFRKQHFGPNSSRTLTVLGEHGPHEVHLVNHYCHLGCVIHHAGDLKMEVRKRLAVAHQTFSKHRKLLFQNPLIPLKKRAQIFQCLIGSRLLYGAESWVLRDQRTKDFVHSAVMRLYRRLLKLAPEMPLHDDDILHQLQLPSPSELLRIARLRYIGSLFACNSVASWGLLNQDQEWMSLMEDDFTWMYAQLKDSSDLLPPHQHLEQWFHIIKWHRSFWKRLIKRASLHAILQRSKHWQLVCFHRSVFDFLNSHGVCTPLPAIPANDVAQVFGCMACGVRCKSKAGEGAHMFRMHGQVCPVRRLFDSSQCFICLREFHTCGKLKHHLLRSHECRRKWLGAASLVPPAPGIGSLEERRLEIDHDRCLPPLQAEGPELPFQRERDFLAYDLALHDDLALMILELPIDQTVVEAVRGCVCERPVSWSVCLATLKTLLDEFQQVQVDFGSHGKEEIITALETLCDPDAWDFLKQSEAKQTCKFADLASIEDACIDLCDQQPQFEPVPRQWGQHRIVLHAFAGRRRKGDFQYYLDKIQAEHPEGVTIHTASVDILYDLKLGDVGDKHTQEFWFGAIDCQLVIGFIGGPPCETWSRARGVQTSDKHHGPRIVRTDACLWGLDCLRIRELVQVLMGNLLLTFAFMCLLRLARVGGIGLLEHPADPEGEESAAIWRLPILHLLRAFPGFSIFTFCQGLLGAPTPKPTTVLCLNLPSVVRNLRAHRTTVKLPRRASIGKTAEGTWATSRLKEYPPALCLALARTFDFEIWQEPVVDHGTPPDAFLAMCAPLLVQEYSDHFGQDFAGGTCK